MNINRCRCAVSVILVPCFNVTTYLLSYVRDELDWIEQGLTSHSIYFSSFWRRWSGCGISQDCSHSQSPQSVRCWVVCAWPLLITAVCVYYLKGIVSVCFRCSARTVGFSGIRLYLYLQPTKQSDAQALRISWPGGSTRGLYNLMVTCTRRRSICYPYSRHPLQEIKKGTDRHRARQRQIDRQTDRQRERPVTVDASILHTTDTPASACLTVACRERSLTATTYTHTMNE